MTPKGGAVRVRPAGRRGVNLSSSPLDTQGIIQPATVRRAGVNGL